METVVEGLSSAIEEASGTGISAGLILCFLRDRPAESAISTLRQIEPFLGKIIGVGLDSAEVGHRPSKSAEVFAQARRFGLHAVAHAGEEGPPEYVWEALDILGGADRPRYSRARGSGARRAPAPGQGAAHRLPSVQCPAWRLSRDRPPPRCPIWSRRGYW
jgi:hypothetical protein